MRSIESLEQRRLLAAQVITPSDISLGPPATFDVSYSVNDDAGNPTPDAKAVGIVLRMHYNSSEIAADLAAIRASDNFGATSIEDQPESEVNTDDNDPSTDRVINYVLQAPNFPAGQMLPVTLFVAAFNPVGGFSEATQVNFTRAPQFDIPDFESTPAIIDFAATTTPSLAVAASSADQDEGDAGTTDFTFTVTRDDSTAGETSVNYSVTGSGTNPAEEADFGSGAFPADTITFADGESEATITINVAGDTSFEMDESFTLTLSDPTGGATLATATAEGVIRNDDSEPVPSLAIAPTNASQIEGDMGTTEFTFTVTRSEVTTGTTTVDYVVAGTGSSPALASDFDGGVFPNGQLMFEDGQDIQTITIPVMGDMEFEPDESFTVTLPSASGGAVISTATANGLIQNDDVSPVASLSIGAANAQQDEGNSGATIFRFTVTRSEVTSGTTTVDFVVGGDGTNPALASDFVGNVFPEGTVTFDDGDVTEEIEIEVAGDTLFEPDEGFVVTLSDASGSAVLDNATASSVIANDDAAPVPTLSIASTNANRSEGNSGTTDFTFTVTRGVDTSSAGTVDFAVTGSGGSPVIASDFAGGVFPNGTLSFAPGSSTAVVTVPVTGDTDIEPDESFLVTLSNASGNAQIVTATASGVVENDDAPPVPTLAVTALDAVRDEVDAGASSFTFRVTRSVVTTGSTSVEYAVTGTGSNPADEDDFGGSLPGGTVVFGPGETTQTITISVSGDNNVEPNERFTVSLFNATGEAVIASSAAEGVIVDNDRPEIQTRILTPSLVASAHVVRGDSIPTGIIFRAVTQTTISVIPVGSTSVTERIRIMDKDVQQISQFVNGVTTATLEPGTLNAILFQPQSMDRIYVVRSSAGRGALTGAISTNLFQPTDTNGDGSTSAVDALVVINHLRRTRTVEGDQVASQAAIQRSQMLDVNGNGRVSALDALLVINHMRRNRNLKAEADTIAPIAAFEPTPLNRVNAPSPEQVVPEPGDVSQTIKLIADSSTRRSVSATAAQLSRDHVFADSDDWTSLNHDSPTDEVLSAIDGQL